MKHAYLITHYNKSNGRIKQVGVFASRETANLCIRHMIEQPGFCDYPDDFRVYKYTIDREEWVQEKFALGAIRKLPIISNEERRRDKKIHFVWHVDRADEWNDNPVMLGIYSSISNAREAAKKLR